jgi:hypothetical protein
MEICLPVWKYREFIDSHRLRPRDGDHHAPRDHRGDPARAPDRAQGRSGDIGAVANTIIVMGSERVGNRSGRFLCVVKHRGSAKSDEIASIG